MAEEEKKPSTGEDTANETQSDSSAAEDKPEIADRLRDMGVMDRQPPKQKSNHRLIVIGAAGIVAAAGLFYWLNTNDQPETPTAQAPGVPAHPGWTAPPQPWAYPGTMPQHRFPPQANQPPWPPQPYGPPPSYYAGRPGDSRFGPPPRSWGQPYGGVPQTGNDLEREGATGNTTENQMPQRPTWMQSPESPVTPTRPEWAQQSPHPSWDRRFGPPARDWNTPPPGWPQEAWRARRPEDIQSQPETRQPQEPPRPPEPRWPEAPQPEWPPQQYHPYGPPPGWYQPSSYRPQDRSKNGNPWS